MPTVNTVENGTWKGIMSSPPVATTLEQENLKTRSIIYAGESHSYLSMWSREINKTFWSMIILKIRDKCT